MTNVEKEQDATQAVPESLRSPIKLTFKQLFAKTLIDAGQREEELRDDILDEWNKLKIELQHRVIAASDYYGLDHSLVKAQWKLNPGSLMRLFSCKFPNAFRIQLDGAPVKPRRNGGWSVKKKMEIIGFVDHLKGGGLTETQACRMLAVLWEKSSLPSIQSLISRYHEAKAWYSSSDNWTAFERLELLQYHQEINLLD